VPPQVDLPAIEHIILSRWRDGNVFERSLEQTASSPRWTFYEGPATANGMPGVHHMAARTFKDLFPRFRTMRGFHVPRKGGWDCHGLPVEVAVEKELGLSGKKEIEAYGVTQFNERCRESVLRHVDAWQEMSERMGYWSDSEHAYRTMDPSYIESVWWSLKVLFDKGLLVKDFRISPYCPRCGTPLSDHEMGQPDVYQTVTDPAITVRFPLTSLPDGAPPQLRGADLLVWTTTPWTLLANTAVAVHPDAIYAVARRSRDGDKVVIADDLFARVLGDGWHVAVRFRGEELIGAGYRRPFGLIEIPNAHVVIPGSFVTTEDGTGLVHLAPAFGADDMAASRAHGLPVVNPVRPDGRFEDDIPLVGGMFFKDTDPRLIADLDDRGLLFRSEVHEHSYPHCWRCGTLLLYYALPSWYIKTTSIKDQLLYQNDKTNWSPETVKSGRYGEWLRNNVDWALSRTRYWGTPLPLWVCPDSHVTCVDSLASLAELAGRDLGGLDPHRPFVDSVTFACPTCGGLATRVPEVIDVWYDSGAMPFAQFGEDGRPDGYPAQFICEGIDQTRGWFYSLMAVGTMVFEQSSYENVLCLGLIVDSAGRKMSKHTGNVLEPLPLMEQYGADALRWFFACSGSPWAARRLSPDALSEIVRKVLLTYWNTASFFTLYANSAEWAGGARGGGQPPRAQGGSGGDRPPAAQPLDRWVLSELNAVVRDVTLALDSFDPAGAGRRLAGFLDDLSNWYVRRSRRSFWEGRSASFATLHECLTTVTLLMAPFAPFLTDYLWGVLGDSSSVHLAAWPAFNVTAIDEALSGQMSLVRRLVELGRSARATAGIRTRQPLGVALVGAAGFDALPPALVELVASELNVSAVLPLDGSSELVDYSVKPAYRSLGQRFGSATPEVAAAITAVDAAAVAPVVLAGDSFPVMLASGSTVLVSPSDVIVTQIPRAGWAVATDSSAGVGAGSGSVAGSGETVALDTTVTPELRLAGLAREVIRLVQDARKTSGLQVSDRIWLRWSTDDSELRQALAEHGPMIAAEVLATDYGPLEDPAESTDRPEFADPDLSLRFWLRPT
jgi:isoleucyl-tRNA synthetase